MLDRTGLSHRHRPASKPQPTPGAAPQATGVSTSISNYCEGRDGLLKSNSITTAKTLGQGDTDTNRHAQETTQP